MCTELSCVTVLVACSRQLPGSERVAVLTVRSANIPLCYIMSQSNNGKKIANKLKKSGNLIYDGNKLPVQMLAFETRTTNLVFKETAQ